MRFPALPNPDLPPEKWEPDTLLACTIWGEARGEDLLGKLAVASVVMNRLKRRNLGQDGVAKIVLAKWQFSCWNEDDPNAEKMVNPVKHGTAVVWDVCATIAALALAGLTADPTRGATHYCTNNLWQTKQGQWYSADEVAKGRTVLTAVIGNHTFAIAP